MKPVNWHSRMFMYARITINEAIIITGCILKYRSHWKQRNHTNESLKGMAIQEKEKKQHSRLHKWCSPGNKLYVRSFGFCTLGLGMARVIMRLSW